MTARALSPISLIAITTCVLMNACASTGAPGKNTPPNSSADTSQVAPAPESQPSDLPQAEQGYAQPPDGTGPVPMAPAKDAEKGQSYSGSQQSMPQPAPQSAPRPAARSATAGAGMNAPSAMADESVASASRPRGEAKSSAPLRRDVGNQPWSVLRIQYDDETGIMARTGRRSYSELLTNIAETSNGYVSVQIVDGSGNALAGLTQGARSFVVGHSGDRYSIRVMNHSSERFEVLATVDGLDVIDGRVGSYSKRGYLIDAYGTLDIDGFRRSSDAVAAFRFGTVRDSYAARTGSDRNVGVIGVAIFRERDMVDERRWEENHRRDNADPFPSRYSTPPTPTPIIRN